MSFLDDILGRMGKTPIGDFTPPEGENAFSSYSSFQAGLPERYPGLDEYTERVNRASEFQTRVRRVIDGDTIETEDNQRVRLVGIDTPETVHPNRAPEPFGQEASDRLSQLLPQGTGINLEAGFENTDARGRLLRFVESEGGQLNKQMIASGLAGLTDFDQPRKQEFLDALEEVVLGQVGAFNFGEQLNLQPTLEGVSENNVAAGLAPLIDELGQPTNPIFAEAFNNDRNRNALAGLAEKAQEASDIFNQLRREVLEDENALTTELQPGETEAEVNELSELLPIKAGLQAALGQEVTAPVPQTDTERNFTPVIGEDGLEIVDVPGDTFGGVNESPGLARLAQAALGVGKDNDPETENDIERFITRFTERSEQIGDAISRPDLAVQRLVEATGQELGDVVDFFSKEGSDADAFAQRLQDTQLVDSDLELLERMSPQLRAQDGPVEFVDEGPGIQSTDIAEFGGNIGPDVVIAALGPGGLPASTIATTKTGRLLTRVGVNALENYGLEGLQQGELDPLNAIAIGAAAGGVFDGAGRLIDAGRTRLIPQNALDDMVRANPELAARMLQVSDQQLDLMKETLRTFDETFDNPSSFLRQDDIAAGANVDDIFREAADGQVAPDIIDKMVARGGLEVDDAIADAAMDAAEAASRNVDHPTHRVRVYKENLIKSVNHLIEQNDYAGAWRTLHRAEVGKHLGKGESREVKEALIDALRTRDPVAADGLRALESQAEAIAGDRTVVTLGDILQSPEKVAKVQDVLRASDDSLRQATDAAKFDPEAGYIRNPFASKAAERYEALDPALKSAVNRGVIADSKPYVEELTKWHNTVRDNLGRIERSGIPQAGRLSEIIDNGRHFEEEFQGQVIGQVLRGTAEIRPMSKYLMEGGSHFKELVRSKTGLGQAQKTWMKKQLVTWKQIEGMTSAKEFEHFFDNANDEMSKVMGDMLSSGKLGIDGDQFKLKFSDSQEIFFGIDELHKAMGVVRIHKGERGDIVDAFNTLIMDRTTDYARRTYNDVAIKQIDDAIKGMKGSYSSSDIQFMEQIRGALTDTSGTHEALTALKNTMAVTRLPMVAVSNLPQMGHTALMFRGRNMARALWRMHAPEWTGNTSRGRVRQMAFNDASGADAVLNEQADMMADFSKGIDPDLARAAGRPELTGTPAKARLAQRYQAFSRRVVGDYYGLKPMERWLRTVAAETGRIHNSNLLKTAHKLIQTPEGENAFRLAWSISDEIQPESPFFKSAWDNTGGWKNAKVQSLVHDMKMLGQWKNADDVMQLKQFSPEDLDSHVAKYFDDVVVRGTGDQADIPEVISRAMGRSGKFASEASQFRVGLQDLPINLNAPGTGRDIWRAVMQFRTFNYKHFDGVFRRYIKDEAKRGNYIPLMRGLAVALPMAQVTGSLTLEFKSWVNGRDLEGGNWIDLVIDRSYGRITDEELDRRLEEMGRTDILAARSFENFQAWGGFGTPGEVIDAFQRGPGSIPGLVSGAGPSSLAAAVYKFGTGDVEGGVESTLGNPFGVTKTFTRRSRDAGDRGRTLETFEPTALERLINDEDQERARVVEQDAQVLRNRSARDKERIEESRPETEPEGIPDLTTPRAEAGQQKAERSADSNRIKADYIDAVMSGDSAGARAAKSEARSLKLNIDFNRIRRQVSGGR